MPSIPPQLFVGITREQYDDLCLYFQACRSCSAPVYFLLVEREGRRLAITCEACNEVRFYAPAADVLRLAQTLRKTQL